jgi:hypothetical protein
MRCGAGCTPSACTRSQPIGPGTHVGRGIKQARRPPRVSFWLGAGLYHAGARGAHSPDEHGVISVSLASGNRHQTLEECARCGRVTGESEQPPGGGVAAWDMALCVEAGAAHAPSVGGQLGTAGSRTSGHLVARLGHAQRRAGTEDYRRLVLEGRRLGGLPEGVGGTATPKEMTTAACRGA